jgi:hypothetical protein
LRAAIVAGIGGLIIGHILWLVGISLATATSSVSTWVLIVSTIVVVLTAAVLVIGYRCYQRKSYVWSAFLLCLPIAPVLLTVIVLGVTYL